MMRPLATLAEIPTSRGQACGLRDVSIGGDWIRGARLVALWRHLPLWTVVEDAIKAYVAQHTRITGPVKDRNRTRSLKQK